MSRFTTFYGMGDPHGMRAQFEALCRWIEDDARARARDAHVINTGDLIDRGDDSRWIVDFVRREAANRFAGWTQLRGNHEEAMAFCMASFGTPDSIKWLYQQTQECLKSYGIDIGVASGRREPVGPEVEGLAALRDDAQWMGQLPLQAVVGDNIFCHAGIELRKHPEKQDPAVILWGDDTFRKRLTDDPAILHPAFGQARIVHGHYPIHAGPEIFRHRINLDTAACFKGPLTCVAFDGPGAPLRIAQARIGRNGATIATRTIK